MMLSVPDICWKQSIQDSRKLRDGNMRMRSNVELDFKFLYEDEIPPLI